MTDSNPITSNAHWLLRGSLASVFLYHGVMKFTNLEGTAAMLSLSMSATVLVALAETVGSLLLILGGLGKARLYDLATRIGALMNIPVMLGAIAFVHKGRWNFVPSETHPMGGMEFQVTLILIMLYIAILGNNRLRGVS
ncbi:DoxX family protein [bacterium AH-315-J23]|nr:DoxX family protein [bacterium AH-315-J23]